MSEIWWNILLVTKFCLKTFARSRERALEFNWLTALLPWKLKGNNLEDKDISTSNPKFQQFCYKTLKIIQKARVNYSLHMLGYKIKTYIC